MPATMQIYIRIKDTSTISCKRHRSQYQNQKCTSILHHTHNPCVIPEEPVRLNVITDEVVTWFVPKLYFI